MGKVSLLLVAAFGVAGATIFFTSNEADVHASAAQGTYEADVIAREIARSAYNAGVADVNRHGLDVDQALLTFGDLVVSAEVPDDEKCANDKPVCARRTGDMLDGTYVVEASVAGGNGVEIHAAGTFGYQAGHRAVSKTHRINESISQDVLKVDPLATGQCGKLKIDFVDSRAGYCSAVLLQRTVNGVVGDPEMVFAPGKNRNGARNRGYEVMLVPGTQMNFAIGVENTSSKGWTCDGTTSRGALPAALRPGAWEPLVDASSASYDPGALAGLLAGYEYDPNHYDWVHWALDGSALLNGEPKEAPWGMVEVDPDNPQRWRVAFEDQPKWNLAPGHRDYNNPNKSLWATKRFGYDTNGNGKGNGWKDKQAIRMVENGDTYSVSYASGRDGFHDLDDMSSPADFSDQVIFVEVVGEACPAHLLPPSSGDGCHDNTDSYDPNCGHGNDPGGYDPDNPGNSTGTQSGK